jgi:hypothetical protein
MFDPGFSGSVLSSCMSLRQLRRCVSPERRQLLPTHLLARSSLFIHSSPERRSHLSSVLHAALLCCIRCSLLPC